MLLGDLAGCSEGKDTEQHLKIFWPHSEIYVNRKPFPDVIHFHPPPHVSNRIKRIFIFKQQKKCGSWLLGFFFKYLIVCVYLNMSAQDSNRESGELGLGSVPLEMPLGILPES